MTYFPDPPFVAQQTLRTWQRKNHPWLELSDVHKETTENVRVTVIPFYMGCRDSPTSSVYWVRIGQMVINNICQLPWHSGHCILFTCGRPGFDSQWGRKFSNVL